MSTVSAPVRNGKLHQRKYIAGFSPQRTRLRPRWSQIALGLGLIVFGALVWCAPGPRPVASIVFLFGLLAFALGACFEKVPVGRPKSEWFER